MTEFLLWFLRLCHKNRFPGDTNEPIFSKKCEERKMSIRKSIAREFSTLILVLIPVAIAINIVIGQIVVLLKLPVFLDSIGTMFVAAVAGPWAGALTGAVTNVIWGYAVDPLALPWWPVALFIGLVTGLCAMAGLFKSWWKVVITGFLVALTAVIVSTPIAVYLYGGITGSGSSFITAFLLQTGRDLIPAVLSTLFIVEPIDKITTALLTFAIIGGLSQRYLARFPRPENVQIEQGNRTTQIIAAIIVAVVLVAIYYFIIQPMIPQTG
jgi:energy-coupling factor transport system substrate-specific component